MYLLRVEVQHFIGMSTDEIRSHHLNISKKHVSLLADALSDYCLYLDENNIFQVDMEKLQDYINSSDSRKYRSYLYYDIDQLQKLQNPSSKNTNPLFELITLLYHDQYKY